MNLPRRTFTHALWTGALIVTALLLVSAPHIAVADSAFVAPPETAPIATPSADGTDLFDFSRPDPMLLWWLAPIGAVLALVFARVFYAQVKRADEGDENMKAIAAHVREGAYAYLRRQYKVVLIFFIIVSALLFVMGQIGVQHKIVFLAFLTAGSFSGLCGFLGMKTATMASNRTAQGAKEGLNRGLTVAFRAGAVMGLVVVGFGLLDVSIWFLILTKLAPAFGYHMSLVEITAVMVTFGMGASSQALFARVGGGIFTKAADVGADLVGKVEAGIPEDDPRNPATIADNVGDNVGDVAGMGADLYESYYASILATLALGVAAAVTLPGATVGHQLRLLAAPMVLAGIGIMFSILGVYMVRTREGASMKQLMGALNLGVHGSSVLTLAAAAGMCYLLLGGVPGVHWLGVWGSIASGLVAGVIIGKVSEYHTSYDFGPTQAIAKSAETGPATVIISGIAEGMKSTWAALLMVIVAIMAAYTFAGGFGNVQLGLYGVGIAAVGMLATLGITLATDAYGPIADNAGGNAEMTGQDPEVRRRTDALDTLGNTTAAIGKGFAIGSAALTALALLAVYVQQVRVGLVREGEEAIVSHYEQGAFEHQGFCPSPGKLAGVGADGKVTAYLVLSNWPKDLAAGSKITFGTFDPADDDNVRGVPIMYTAADASGKRVARTARVEVVPAEIATLNQFMDFYNATLMNPKVLCGLFSGVLLVFLFSAMTMKAVGRTAYAMVNEVRRQFREIVGIMDGTGEPDYARCVAISTAGAQKAMIVPSLLALIAPVVVGLMLGVPGVLGMLAGGLTCGFAMAIFMANAGGAWDNAKKYIETGQMGGKGSDAHKAAVVGDTVGDPFKDTSGPSLNILIKLMGMVSVVFAGLVVKFAPRIAAFLGIP